MATANDYASWIVANQNKQGTPEFDTVAQAYKQAKMEETVGPKESSMIDTVKNLAKQALVGKLQQGAGFAGGVENIANNLRGGYEYLTGQDKNLNTLITGKSPREQRKAEIEADLVKRGANLESPNYQMGKLASELVATYPVGGALGKVAQTVGASPKLVAALKTGGFDVGGATGLEGLATRALGGAATTGASTALISPEDAGTGAAIGGAIPVVGKIAGSTGQSLAKALRGNAISPEVKGLADKAAELGIDIPADRLTDSKFMNAIASSLNYVPFSGRAGVEQKMEQQLNKAASRTFGQDSENITQALRQAKTDLSGKFESTLQNNKVKVDNDFMNDLSNAVDLANKELGADSGKIIKSQVDEILNKVGPNGEIDGKAAYNIKKRLDIISDRNSPEAFYADELKKSLMSALNRSLGEDEAAAFATVRKQYGNMLSLRKLAKNGAEGGISVARLANLQHINNPELQTLADIAAQFIKPRESQHGAMQRAAASLGVGSLAGLPALAGTVAGGRALNAALQSPMAKNFVQGQGSGAVNQKLIDALKKSLQIVEPVVIAD
jgi:hypothetical protein